MADQQFDGNTPVSGYTLFKGKDGQNFYLKGENLADEEITSRVAKLRGTASQSSEAQQVQAGLPGYPKPAQPQPSNLGTIATGPPLMSMQPGLPSAAQVPQNAERMSEGAMIGAPIGGVISGGAAALPAIGRSIAQGTALGAAGKYLGNMISPTTGHVLGTLGALAGGIRGARSAPEMEEIPPEWTSPTHTEIPSGSPEYPLSAKIKAGTAMKIPSRLTKAQIEALRPQEPAKLSDLATQVPTEGGSKLYGPESKAPHVEGSYWSFKESSLRQAVLAGDRDAAIVYRQRFGNLPAGAGYLTDVGSQPLRGLYKSEK